MESLPRRPVRLVVRDDALERGRLGVAFRLLLALPHLVWLALWTSAALAVAAVGWLAVLVERRVPGTLHRFLAQYVRYSTHVGAYLTLAAAPYPGFTGAPGYPVDAELDPPAAQGRAGAAFRLVLAVPALLLAATLWGGVAGSRGGGVAATAAVLGWFACLAVGRMPRGLRDLSLWALGYGAQTSAYVLLLTDRYPDARPDLVEPPYRRRPHPVRLVLGGDLRRHRLLVVFRLLLLLPHLVWLALWTALVVVAWLPLWLVALAAGGLPAPIHRSLAAYVRAVAHVSAFASLVGGPFPGFTGAAGSYPVDVELDPPGRGPRLRVLGRPLLVLPALLLSSALGGVLLGVALLGWWAALFTGRMPAGLRDAGAAALRYGAQTSAYGLFVSGSYPDGTPSVAPARDDREPQWQRVSA